MLPVCDAVVMLSISDWPSEPRSNRYHFATRFARHKPVVFVQADRAEPGYAYESSGSLNIDLLHISQSFDEQQIVALKDALRKRGIVKPLVWVFFAAHARAALELDPVMTILHATEDYFQEELSRQLAISFPTFYSDLALLFSKLDLLIAVSDGVLRSYEEKGSYKGEALVLENGCDYAFWQESGNEARQNKVAFYQGGINYRLDTEIIAAVASSLPDWEFRFCGSRDPRWHEWDRLLSEHANVVDLGMLSPLQFARESWRATVGLIPFVQTPFIVDVSLPLKAFEYVACGLPVVTVPIRSLERWPHLFVFATNATDFAQGIVRAAATVNEPTLVRSRAATAARRDYDVSFDRLLAFLQGRLQFRAERGIGRASSEASSSASDEPPQMPAKEHRTRWWRFGAN